MKNRSKIEFTHEIWSYRSRSGKHTGDYELIVARQSPNQEKYTILKKSSEDFHTQRPKSHKDYGFHTHKLLKVEPIVPSGAIKAIADQLIASFEKEAEDRKAEDLREAKIKQDYDKLPPLTKIRLEKLVDFILKCYEDDIVKNIRLAIFLAAVKGFINIIGWEGFYNDWPMLPSAIKVSRCDDGQEENFIFIRDKELVCQVPIPRDFVTYPCDFDNKYILSQSKFVMDFLTGQQARKAGVK